MAMPRESIKFSPEQSPKRDRHRQADINREGVENPAEFVEPKKLVLLGGVDLTGPASRRKELVVGLFVAEVDFGRGRRGIVARVDGF